MEQRALAIVLALALVASGCSTTRKIGRRELEKLDGFQPDRPVTLEDRHGDAFTFTSDHLLALEGPSTRFPRKYASIRCDEKHFVGITCDGEVVEVELDDIRWGVVTPEGLSKQQKSELGHAVLGAGAVVLVFGVLAAVVGLPIALYFLLGAA